MEHLSMKILDHCAICLEVFLLVTKQDTPFSTIEGILGITRIN